MKTNRIVVTLIIILLIMLSGLGVFYYTRDTKKEPNDSQKQKEITKDNEEEYNEILNRIKDTDTYKYYETNSSKIVTLKNVTSDNVLSEKEAKDFLEERGFNFYPITYDSSLEGDFVGDTDIDPSSNEKHPTYLTTYRAKNNVVWSIHLIGKLIFASPTSYLLDTNAEVEILLSEFETVTSYDDKNNVFFVTIPKETSAIIKTVDKIDASTLDNYTFN